MGREKYKNIESLEWSDEELKYGKIIKIKSFPAEKKVKLFRVTVSTDRTDYVDLAYQTGQTVYKIKHKLLSNYLIQQLKRPDVNMCLV